MRGTLVELAKRIDAADVGGKKGIVKNAEEAERRRRGKSTKKDKYGKEKKENGGGDESD